MRRFPHQLSGGQQQRVALAIALAMEPAMVVLDEPTTGLDVVTQRRILDEIARLRDETGTAMVYVTHDLAAVSAVADRIAVMYAGRIVELGGAASLLGAPLHPYTSGLVASVPDHVVRRRLHGIKGVAVGAGDRPSGCAFAARCPQVVPLCRSRQPELLEVRAGRQVRCTEWQRTPALSVGDAVAAAIPGEARAALLRVEEVWAVHPGAAGQVTAAREVSFSIEPGEALALVGESGSGKTTIARCIAGLHRPASGLIAFDGAPVPALARRRTLETRRDIQLIFQSPYESLSPRQRIGDQIARPARQLRGLGRGQARAEVANLLERVQLPASLMHRYPAELSGGERQRVAIARALAAGPRLLVCDEITSALDVSVQAQVLNVLRGILATRELSMLFISHNLAVVRYISDDLAVMRNGVIVEAGRVEDVLAAPRHPYTRELLDAIPHLHAPGTVTTPTAATTT
jgi:peptide/nickel transport system ATP-binding protein